MRRRLQEAKLAATEIETTVNDNEIGRIAVFFDFENIVLGIKNKFEANRVVEHLSGRGDVVIRRAYADWGKYHRYQQQLLELGVEMVFLPTYGVADKNRTDTAIAVDAMEILFRQPDIDTFVIVSGDSDFAVLARKLRGYGKRMIGISARNAASKVLVSVCHEFIFYETLVGEKVEGYDKTTGEKLLKRILPAIVEDYGTTFQPSLIKDRLRKIDSTFSERNFGFGSFNKFLASFPHLLEVHTYRGGRVEVDVLEPSARGAAPGGGGRDDDLDDDDLDLTRARDTLKRCMSAVRSEGVAIGKLKNLMVAEQSDFDQRELGYSSFADFLRDQGDLVTLARDGRSYRVERTPGRR